MKTYIGVKAVQAEPQTEAVADGETGRPGYAVVYEDGYRSWSPADVFEEAYVEVPADAADALLAMTRNDLSAVAAEAMRGSSPEVITAISEQLGQNRTTAFELAIRSSAPGSGMNELLARAVSIETFLRTGKNPLS